MNSFSWYAPLCLWYSSLVICHFIQLLLAASWIQSPGPYQSQLRQLEFTLTQLEQVMFFKQKELKEELLKFLLIIFLDHLKKGHSLHYSSSFYHNFFYHILTLSTDCISVEFWAILLFTVRRLKLFSKVTFSLSYFQLTVLESWDHLRGLFSKKRGLHVCRFWILSTIFTRYAK